MEAKRLAARIDHTLVEPEADLARVDRLADEATRFGFAAACVNPIYVRHLRGRLEGSGVKASTVVGFPLGANSLAIKGIETREAVENGAEEIDVVPNVAVLLSGDFDATTAELAELVRAARASNPHIVVKAIVESTLLMRGVDEAEAGRRIQRVCRAVRESGCDFIRTSTGFHPAGGATIEAVALLKANAGGLQVKAAGGIRDFQDAVRMLRAGADRLGCSRSVAILDARD